MKSRVIACIAATAAIMLSGCAQNAPENISQNFSEDNKEYAPELMFDYFRSDDMPWEETKVFSIPEFSDVDFKWNYERIVMIKESGEEAQLFWGMPVWGVYLADLNGDGKREICSTVSMGSGIVDERVYAYDYANGKLYALVDRFMNNYRLELRDGILMYVKYPERTPASSDREEIAEALTLDKMTEVNSSEI